MADYLSVPFKASTGVEGRYHYFPAEVSVSRGLLVYLDGDGQYGHDHPTSTWALGGRRGIIAQGRARGLDVVSTRAPLENMWWRQRAAHSTYFAELLTYLISRYNIDPTRIWLVGYSGGAQFLAQAFMPAHSSMLKGGGVVMCGGGGPPVLPVVPFTQTTKDAVSLHWVTGTEDIAANSTEGYDGLGYARKGHTYYAAQGFTVTGRWPAGIDHNEIGCNFGRHFANAYDWHTR